MKKQHVFLINAAAIGLILGLIIAAVVSVMFDSDSTQDEAESQAETQIEMQTESETQAEAEAEEVSSTELTDAEFVKSMPERDQAHLIAIVCLATEKGNSPSDIAESIADNFDAISEDYAQSFVSASLITVCSQTAE